MKSELQSFTMTCYLRNNPNGSDACLAHALSLMDATQPAPTITRRMRNVFPRGKAIRSTYLRNQWK